MSLLKNIGVLFLWVVFFAVASYAWNTHFVPCAEPIEYKIGTVDPRFGVTKAELVQDLKQAGDLWGAPVGRSLFAYNEQGSVVVNLVYDARQQITEQEDKLNDSIGETSQVADSVKEQYQAPKDKYNAAKRDYEAKLAQFNEEQDAYNTSVEYWNARGGAPPKEYAKLSGQQKSLAAQHDALEQKRQEVNRLVDEVNTLNDKYNLLVGRINTIVDTINNDGLTGTEFEQGVYMRDMSGERINIYQFDTKVAFVRVLAHELGHALGLSHTGGAESIMNPINRGKKIALTAEDTAALKARCNIE